VTATGTAGLLQGEPNMRFDGTNFYLSSYSGGSVSSNTTLITIPTASGNSAVFDYFVSDGANTRAGTVMTAWVGSSTVFTDYSTPDIGSTTGISFSTSSNGTNLSLNVVITGGGPWTIKVGSRIMF
jgi:hypothetical protein